MISYSIIISAYNQVDNLKMALECLRKQIKTPKIYEIVIPDDCSNDGTSDYIKKLRYPIFLKYSRSETKQGRALNRNRGFQKAAGDWLIFIDGDMVPGPDFIDAYCHAWEEFPDGVSIGSFGYPSDWQLSKWQRYLASRGRLVMKHGDKVPGKYFTSGNFSIKKSLLENLGGFDTTFAGWGGEDTDFGLQLDMKKIPLYYVSEAFCAHYHKKSLPEILNEYEKFGQNGYPLLIKKHPDDVIFKKGWLLGLPDSNLGPSRKLASLILKPFQSRPALGLLKRLANIGDGAILNDFFFDWLFYGHLAKGYRYRAK
jgi:glycosyltransferase involved in cell wall biosynthesis